MITSKLELYVPCEQSPKGRHPITLCLGTKTFVNKFGAFRKKTVLKFVSSPCDHLSGFRELIEPNRLDFRVCCDYTRALTHIPDFYSRTFPASIEFTRIIGILKTNFNNPGFSKHRRRHYGFAYHSNRFMRNREHFASQKFNQIAGSSGPESLFALRFLGKNKDLLTVVSFSGDPLAFRQGGTWVVDKYFNSYAKDVFASRSKVGVPHVCPICKTDTTYKHYWGPSHVDKCVRALKLGLMNCFSSETYTNVRQWKTVYNSFSHTDMRKAQIDLELVSKVVEKRIP